ncbi:mediator of RNA polymerase II transcription subunit 25-like [Hyaena hyaena]|uniref:mediator of RNA polymerase II transcription subunit 25-like n=1 Tax=Hyaena hyaena TaxID=95912 RepID=UPI0019209718|nr:mediator of RNA polymerase II transcription subunit 25-like [Hyaena hyaena]
MQTPRVEWFVSKGQRLPIGQSPPDVTGARLLLVCARLAEFFAYLRQLQSQPGAAAGGRAAPHTRLPGREAPRPGRPPTPPRAARAPKPGASVPRSAVPEQPGWRPLMPQSPCTPAGRLFSKAVPSAFKERSPPLTSSLHLPPPVPL